MKDGNRLIGVDALRMMSGLLIVVFHFSYCLRPQNSELTVRTVRALAWVTPVFFLISGYLQGRNYERQRYATRFAARIMRLLLPFCCWNLLFAFGYLFFSRISPALINQWAGRNVYTVGWFLSKVFGFATIPGDPVLWYVRELLLVIVILPFIVWGLSGKAVRTICFIGSVLGLVVALESCSSSVEFSSTVWVPSYSVVCIVLSVWLGLRRVDVESFCGRHYRFLIFLGVSAIVACVYKTFPYKDLILTGGAFLWLGFLPLLRRLVRYEPFKSVSKLTFFIYAAHYAFIPVLGPLDRKLLALCPPCYHWIMYIVLTVLFSCVDIVLCLGLYDLIRRISPSMASMLNGGGIKKTKEV